MKIFKSLQRRNLWQQEKFFSYKACQVFIYQRMYDILFPCSLTKLKQKEHCQSIEWIRF